MLGNPTKIDVIKCLLALRFQALTLLLNSFRVKLNQLSECKFDRSFSAFIGVFEFGNSEN
jgi:hypothetical protein